MKILQFKTKFKPQLQEITKLARDNWATLDCVWSTALLDQLWMAGPVGSLQVDFTFSPFKLTEFRPSSTERGDCSADTYTSHLESACITACTPVYKRVHTIHSAVAVTTSLYSQHTRLNQ